MVSEQEHFDVSRQWQAHFDNILRTVGARAPQPILGQTTEKYIRETYRDIKRTFLPQNHPLYQPNYRGMPADALAVFGPQLLEACVKEANNPAHVPPGELRKIERLDEYGKVRCIDWVGQNSFVKQMMRPGRRVVSFTTDRGKYNASKGSWF